MYQSSFSTPSPIIHIYLIPYLLLLYQSSSNFQCATFKSNVSETEWNSIANISCNSSYPTRVSCGFSPYDKTDQSIKGAGMPYNKPTANWCIARNGRRNGSYGAYAYARYIM